MKKLYCVLVAGLVGLGVTNAHSNTVLDFEDLAPGTTVTMQYGPRGVLFSNHFLGTDPAAHSGTHVLRSARPSDEIFTPIPLAMTFPSAQARVKLFAASTNMALNGTLTAFDTHGAVVAHDGPKLVAANVFTTVFEVIDPKATPSITRAELRLENGVHFAIDTLEFEGKPPVLWSNIAPYQVPAYTRPPDDSVALGSLLEGAGWGPSFNSDWTDISSGNFCGGWEQELVLLKNKHSNFSILRGPTPYPVGTFDSVSAASHPWRAVTAGNLDGGDYDEIVAIRKVTADGVPDLVVAKASESSCEVSTVMASAMLGNPSNSEWLDAAVGDFDGTGTKQIVLLKAAHSNFFFVQFIPPSTLNVLSAADLDSHPTRPWKAVAAGDIDHDGVDELIAARQVSDGRGATVLAYKWTGAEFSLLATSTFGNNGNSNWASAAVGDFNADGRKAIVLVKNRHSNFVVLDYLPGATQLRVLSTADLDSVEGQDWRGLAATDWLAGSDQGASELIAVRAAHDSYQTDVFVYGNPFHRVARDTGLSQTRAQWDQIRAPLGATPEQLAAFMTNFKAAIAGTHTNTVSWTIIYPADDNPHVHDYNELVRFLEATKDFGVDGRQLRVWATLVPLSSEGCSAPEDSPDTPWDELVLFKADTPGGICRDLLGWAKVLGRLAQDYPHLIAVGIDDFMQHPEMYPGEYLAEMQSNMRSQAPWMSFVPFAYYRNFKKVSLPDITRSFDTMLFFFRNEGQDEGYRGCLTDPCGQNSIGHAPGEIAFMSGLLPAGRKLQLGTYWVPLYPQGLPPEIPSIQYDHDLTLLAASLPELGGVTAYSMEIIGERVQSPTAGVVCDEFNFLEDRYCTLRKVYGVSLPVADFHYATLGLSVSLADSSTDPDGGTIVSRLWRFDDGTSSTAANLVKTFANPGTYPISLTVTDSDGDSRQVVKPVTLTLP